MMVYFLVEPINNQNFNMYSLFDTDDNVVF
jgi:hypothetical protein